MFNLIETVHSDSKDASTKASITHLYAPYIPKSKKFKYQLYQI